jgi:hypothetical protein
MAVAVVSESLTPLDVVEQVMRAEDWPFERDDDEITMQVKGQYGNYEVSVIMLEGSDLHFACHFDFEAPLQNLGKCFELLLRSNGMLLRGHFDLRPDLESLIFRIVLLDSGSKPLPSRCRRVIRLALETCEAYKPLFTLAASGGDAVTLLDAGFVDPRGQA